MVNRIVDIYRKLPQISCGLCKEISRNYDKSMVRLICVAYRTWVYIGMELFPVTFFSVRLICGSLR